jgi:hypothetical protein
VHLIDGFWETLFGVQPDGFFKQHYVHATWFTDAQLSYSLIFTPPVEAAPVPGYSLDQAHIETHSNPITNPRDAGSLLMKA